MSEACILANVHVPLGFSDVGSKANCKRTGLPILVFIHGGGFQIGSGDSDLHGPEYLVSKGVIVITFNYRLAVLFFYRIVGAFINILTHVNKQLDPEQLPVGHTNIYFVRKSNPHHTAQQSIAEPVRQPCLPSM